MSKKGLSIFFSVVFLLFIVAPTILVMVDDSVDVSIVFSTSEEEEKGNEKSLDIEALFSMLKTNNYNLVFTFPENSLEHIDKRYTKPHLNIISPPPELHIL
ncbi:MAG: hypothetical protein ACI9SI_000029 [Polaribacter sp.]|jgi:hypothetical protein